MRFRWLVKTVKIESCHIFAHSNKTGYSLTKSYSILKEKNTYQPVLQYFDNGEWKNVPIEEVETEIKYVACR